MHTGPVALALDIGGTRMKAALVNSAGEILRVRETRTPLALKEAHEELRGLLGGVRQGEAIRGVGIACKGIIDTVTTRVVRLPGSLCYLEGHVLSEIVCRALGDDPPVYADNDARVALAGEWVWGAARGLRNALLFTLGTGVGGGILADGRILRGHAGIAGHLGHLTVDPDGPPCICGNYGCLETVFSARVIESEGRSAIHRGLLPGFSNSQAPATCAEIFAASSEGNAIARWIVDRGIRKLGAAIAGLVHALDPEVVIIGGQVATAGEILFEPLRREVWKRTEQLLQRHVPVIPVAVSDPSGVVGAAALVFENAD